MRLLLPYNCYRVMGIATLFLIGYIIVIGIFGNVDISGLLPTKLAATIQAAWPQMPFFDVEKVPLDSGKDGQQMIYYTVPTRQFTPQEIAQMQHSKSAQKSPVVPSPTSAAAAR